MKHEPIDRLISRAHTLGYADALAGKPMQPRDVSNRVAGRWAYRRGYSRCKAEIETCGFPSRFPVVA